MIVERGMDIRHLLVFLALQLVAGRDSGEAIVRRMHDRYAGKWYRTMTFVRTLHKPNPSDSVRTYFDTIRLPGYLRIDGGPGDPNGLLFTAESTYTIHDGAVAVGTASPNRFFLLRFDVYVDPVEKTLATLRGRGFDLTKGYDWVSSEGRDVYVVGAGPMDDRSKQFWIDKERLVVVRQIDDLSGHKLELRYQNFRPIANGWIPTQVEWLEDDHHVMFERYDDIKANVPLDSALFDPAHWLTARHWTR
jgi:hypothetical protein